MRQFILGIRIAALMIGFDLAVNFWLPQRAHADDWCGGQGQVQCTEQEMDAAEIGPAQRWGCQGRQLYFSPRNGGECWQCPDGYRRKATKPIFAANSCEKRGMFDFETVNATFIRSVYGCGAGTFHQGDSCWSCEAGFEKKPFALTPTCKRIEEGCDAGYVKGPVPFNSLAEDYDLSRTRYCTSIGNLASLVPHFREPISRLENAVEGSGAFKDFLQDMAGDPGDAYSDAIRAKNYQLAFNVLKGLDSFQTLATSVSNDYRTFTVSFASGVVIGVGQEIEYGLAIDLLDMRARPYEADTRSVGFELGGGGTIAVGVWTVPVNDLGGAAQGVTAGIPIEVGVSAGGAQWFSFVGPNSQEQYLGKQWLLGMGLSVGTGKYLQTHTSLR